MFIYESDPLADVEAMFRRDPLKLIFALFLEQ